ncbi:MAG: hypothetical protein P1P81_00210 [Desulfobulbales bacterium]|nr:hypothetical protein [Desulfobulbales bacterium]
MQRTLISALVVMLLLSACAVVPGRRGGVEMVPLLPPVVVLDVEPYYVHNGYHYHYRNGAWLYSTSRNGPWLDLPRSHYPKEVRYKGKRGGQGRGRDKDKDRDHDNRRR